MFGNVIKELETWAGYWDRCYKGEFNPSMPQSIEKYKLYKEEFEQAIEVLQKAGVK